MKRKKKNVNVIIIGYRHHQKNPCSHPVFFINGVKGEVLRAILDFMYMGEVHINNEDLIDFIEMAEQFKIRGVTKENSVRKSPDSAITFTFNYFRCDLRFLNAISNYSN